MIDALFSNAMTWVHFRLSGGLRALVTYCIMYGLLVGGGVLLTISMQGPNGQRGLCETWAWGLLGLQVFGVVSWAPIRVFSAIRHDVTNRRIESHRLMPIEPVPAILGYIFGQCSHLAALCVVNLVIVLIVGSFGGVQPILVAAATLAMVGTTLFLCSLFAMLAWVANAGVVYTFTSIAAWILMQGAYRVVPGMMLLISVQPQLLQFQFMRGGPNANQLLPFVVTATVAQLLFSALFIRAAARRFTSDRLMLLTPLAALVLLILWVGVSAVAMQFIAGRNALYWNFETRLDALAWTTYVGLGISLVMVLAQVRAEADYHIRRAIAGPAAANLRKPIVAFWILAGAVAVVYAISFADTADLRPSQPIGLLVVSLVAAVAQVYLGAKIIHRLCKRYILVMVLFVAVIWIGPFLAQLIYSAAASTIDTPHGQYWLANGSVLRTVSAIYSYRFEHADEVFGGVIFQVALAVVLGVASRLKRSYHI